MPFLLELDGIPGSHGKDSPSLGTPVVSHTAGRGTELSRSKRTMCWPKVPQEKSLEADNAMGVLGYQGIPQALLLMFGFVAVKVLCGACERLCPAAAGMSCKGGKEMMNYCR